MPGWAFNAQKGRALGVKRQNVHHSGRLTPRWHKREDSVFNSIFFKFSKFFKIKSFSNHIFSIKSLSNSISFYFQKYLLSINDLIQHFKYVAFSVEKGLMFESYLFLLAKSLIFQNQILLNYFSNHIFSITSF